MRDSLLRPLGMPRTTFRAGEASAHPAAAGHEPAGDEPGAAVRLVRATGEISRHWPAGAAHASAEELARMVIALANDGRVGARQAIPAGAVRRASARHVRVPNIFADAAYGYGMLTGPYRGETSLWHDGQVPGFGAVFRVVPARRLGVVVLLDRAGVRPDRLVDAGFDALGLAAVPAAAAQAPVAPVDAATAARLAGRYVNRLEVELVARDGTLYRRWLGGEQRVWAIGAGRFTVDSTGENPAAAFTVVPAAGGRPAFAQVSLWTFPKVER